MVDRSRRRFTQALGCALPLAGCQSPPRGAAAPSTAPLPDDAAARVREAFEYAFPLYEMARTRWAAVDNPFSLARARANAVQHRRGLSDHRARAVTTPNNDTLYSSCWIDLSGGPVRVEVSAMPAGRYWSVALMDMFGNNVAILGRRLDGNGPVQLTVLPPGWRGPRPDGRSIEAPGHDLWLLGRWLVDGLHDLLAAQGMQDGLRVVAAGDTAAPSRPRPTGSADAENFLAVVNHALAHNPPPAADAAVLARLQVVGLRPGEPAAWQALPAAVQALWSGQMAALHASLRDSLERSARVVEGWRLPPAAIGDYGAAYGLRAAVALGGLAALPTVEAVYFSRSTDSAGAALDGAVRYRIRVPASGIPNDAFWSLSVYERMPDGRLFFTDNPIGRYAVSDRTPRVLRQDDGSIDLWLQREAPTVMARRANWLPAPAGAIQLMLRAYVPRPEVREGRAALPTVERLG